MAQKFDESTIYERILMTGDPTAKPGPLFIPSVKSNVAPTQEGPRISEFQNEIKIEFVTSHPVQQTGYAVWYRLAGGTFLQRVLPASDGSNTCLIDNLYSRKVYDIFIVKYVNGEKDTISKHKGQTK